MRRLVVRGEEKRIPNEQQETSCGIYKCLQFQKGTPFIQPSSNDHLDPWK